MKKILTIICLFLSMFCVAQHCPFDNSGVIAVKIIDKNTKEVIKDATPFIKVYNKKGAFILEEKMEEYPDVEDAYGKTYTMNFYWVKHQYATDSFVKIVTLDYASKNDVVIEIKDKNGNKLQQTHKVEKNNYYPLCSAAWEHDPLYNKKTIIIEI